MDINDKIISQVPHKKVLGIIVDENLGFIQHVQERQNKGFKALNVLIISSTIIMDVPKIFLLDSTSH